MLKTKATETHSKYAIVFAFLPQSDLKNSPHCYVIRSFAFVRIIIFIANTFKVPEFVYFTEVYFLQFRFSIQIRLRRCFARVVIITLSMLLRL
jgi:hypothetical protein